MLQEVKYEKIVMALLTKAHQNEIDAKIDEIRLKLDFSYPENNILDITEKMGMSVFSVNLPKNMSGAIRYNDGKPEIYLNSNMGQERKTFTLAHEIGHFILGHVNESNRKYRIDTFDYKNNSPEALEETKANYFAASLLVPKHRLKKVISALGSDSDSIPIIAKYFGVSEAVIVNRLRWLKQN